MCDNETHRIDVGSERFEHLAGSTIRDIALVGELTAEWMDERGMPAERFEALGELVDGMTETVFGTVDAIPTTAERMFALSALCVSCGLSVIASIEYAAFLSELDEM